VTRRRLDAWKEIAQYLGRDVTTVRRWEKREGLPVHRHLHDKLGSVFAYADEIDAWSARRSIQTRPVEDPPPAAEPSAPIAPPAAATISLAVTPARPWTWSPVWRVVVATASLAAIVLATSSLWTPRPRARSNPVIRKVAVAPPPGTVVESLAISPDGEQAVLMAGRADGMRLWIKRLDSTTEEPLAGTEGASFPFWSPDGQHVGFFAGGWLKRIALSTREIHDIALAPNGHGGTWNERGDIVFAPTNDAPLSHVLASGGQLTTVTVLGRGFKEGHAWPEFLPDGRHFLYTDYGSEPDRLGIYVADLGTKTAKRLLPVYSSAGYSRDGFLWFVKGSLMAQPFDLDRLEVKGTAVSVADQVRQRYELGMKSDFSISQSGVVAVRSAGVDQNRLVWIDRRTGKETASIADSPWYANPTLSADGTKLLVTAGDGATADNLWLFENTLAGRRVTFGRWDSLPVWSAAGDRVIFSSANGLVEQNLIDGSKPVPVLRAKMGQFPESRSRDGHYMTVTTLARGTRSDIWAWKLDEPREMFPILNTVAQEGQSQISPDGRYLAYVSDASGGRFEVFVQSFPAPTQRWQVSTGGGADPRWVGKGHELTYIAADRRMMAVRTKLQPQFSFEAARPLFQTQLDEIWLGDTRNHYDVTPDGRRFIMLAPKTDRRLSPYTVLINWQPPSER
jgi:Tol biopolymer transport system component